MPDVTGLGAVTKGPVEFEVYRKRARESPTASESRSTKDIGGSLRLIIPFKY